MTPMSVGLTIVAIAALSSLMGLGYYVLLRRETPDYPRGDAKLLSCCMSLSLYSTALFLSL